jgi:transcriptional regulator with XRE-family HTH domain
MKNAEGGKSFKEILGRNIKRLRTLQNITQLELAVAVGYGSSGMISQVERGDKGMDSEKIYAAAEFLGVHPSVLFSPTEWNDDQLEMAIKSMKVIKEGKSHPLYETLRSLLQIQ